MKRAGKGRAEEVIATKKRTYMNSHNDRDELARLVDGYTSTWRKPNEQAKPGGLTGCDVTRAPHATNAGLRYLTGLFGIASI